MNPVICHIFDGIYIYSYGLCMAIAFISGFGVFYLRFRRSFSEIWKALIIFEVTIIGGLTGSYLLYVISNFSSYLNPEIFQFNLSGRSIKIPHPFNFMQGGMVFYGGFLGGLLSGGIITAVLKMSVLEIMDHAASAIAFAHGWGRIGCFMAGCCYGIPCSRKLEFICVRFPEGSLAYDDFFQIGSLKTTAGAFASPLLLPVQLFESFLEFVISFVLMHIFRFRRGRGQVMGLYLIFYGLIRFALEYLRFDPYRGHFLMFSTSQWISLFLIPSGLWLYLQTLKRKVGG